jgi:opacity protein-like surface antigen
MKKLFLAAVAILIGASVVMSQGKTSFSIGLEASVPSGLFHTSGYNFGIGGSAQLEYKVASDMGLTLNGGYISYANKSTASHFNVIPVMAGVKYGFSPKVYAHAQLGAAFNKNTYNNLSNTGFAYSAGVGFLLSKNLDLLVKYFGNSIGKSTVSGVTYPGGTFGSFGARLAYALGNK